MPAEIFLFKRTPLTMDIEMSRSGARTHGRGPERSLLGFRQRKSRGRGARTGVMWREVSNIHGAKLIWMEFVR